MVVAVARAVEAGARAVVCASTGNTAASAAAYAARAGLDAIVLTPAGATATAKRAQAVAAGARLIELRGSFDDALRICRELGAAARLRARQLAQPGSDRGPEVASSPSCSSSSAPRRTSSRCRSAAAAT